MFCPPAVSDFVVELLSGVEAAAVLDPWVCQGELLHPVLAKLKPDGFVAAHPSEQALEAARQLLSTNTSAGEFRLGRYGENAPEPNETFDVVVSIPPMSGQRERFSVGGEGLMDSAGREILLHSALTLRPTGLGLYVVAPSFLLSSRNNEVAARLGAFGLYIDAAFLFPAGTFRPFTGIETYLVAIRRGVPPATMFVAEVAEENKQTILANYNAGRSVEEPELGVRVDRATFSGVPQLIEKRRFERQTNELDFARARLADLCVSIEALANGATRLPEADNAFFFPTIRSMKCTADAASVSPGSPTWLHVCVDPRLAEARMVVGYLNGPLGQLAMDSMASGAGVRFLSRAVVPDIPIFLPCLEEQQDIIQVDQRLNMLSDEIQGLRAQLWKRLEDAQEIKDNLEKVNREDTFSYWLDTLPFPLASILWTYNTLKGEPQNRCTQLDYFFEGLSKYLAILFLSAVRADKKVFPDAWKVITEVLASRGMSLEQASTGTWVTIYSKLAKLVRGELNKKNGEERAYWQRIFACGEPELLAALTNKRMVSLLQTANAHRNRWRGHGGFAGPEEARRRESIMWELLLDFRGQVRWLWEGYRLVRPLSSTYAGGLHRIQVVRIMGVRTPFERETVEVRQPMEDGQLHMVSQRLEAICPLLPLVKLGASPKEELNTCYFFNRVEKGAHKFVSYHLAAKGEIEESSADVQAVLAELTGASSPDP